MTDLFAKVEETDQKEKAKILLRKMPADQDGYKLGCVSFLQRKMSIKYGEAAQMLRDLVESGFVTEADHQGRRKLLAP